MINILSFPDNSLPQFRFLEVTYSIIIYNNEEKELFALQSNTAVGQRVLFLLIYNINKKETKYKK